MTTISVIIGAAGLAGIAFGVFCGVRLARWERQLAGARIAVAYKQKIRLQAPLIEWLKWCEMLDRDQQSTGRVVYRQANTSVAILKPSAARTGTRASTETRTIKEPEPVA